MIESQKKIVIEAIIDFKKSAEKLVEKLLFEFEIPLNQENPFSLFLIRQNNLWKGSMKENWFYWFHGDACEFENSETKQLVYVKINRNGNYGVIDNFYLYRFIQTTKSLEYVYKKINSEKILYELILELEKDKIIINIDEIECLKTRVLNYNLINGI
jgi:hypothetical protein